MISNVDLGETGDVIRIRVHQGTGTVVLQRPERHNAISRRLIAELKQALEDLLREKQVSAVILAGAGPSFSSGTDLAELKASMSDDNAQQQWFEDSVAQKELVEQLLRYPKPILAAVHGAALGLGAAIVLATDIVVGAPQAAFGFPEVRRGLVAGMAAPLLAFRLGTRAATELLLHGDPLTGEQCLNRGIYHHLVEPDMVWARADQIARELVQSGPEAVAMTKRLVNESIGEQLWTQLVSGAAATATARTTESASEGVAAFLEKRDPDWHKPIE